MTKRTPVLTALIHRHCTMLGLGKPEGWGWWRWGKRRMLHFTLQVPGQGMVGSRDEAVFSRVPLCAFDQTMPRPRFCDELQRKQVRG